MNPIKIAIVDDQNLFRQSLGLLIKSIPEFELVAEAADGFALLESLTQMQQLPDILLMDMNMPGMNGIELNTALQKDFAAIKVIVLSVHTQDRLISKMITAGAAAYLIKNCDKDELITAINSTYQSGFYMSKQVMLALQETARIRRRSTESFTSLSFELTEREQQVLELICQEQSSAEIAERLFLSIRTVEGHRNNLLLKTESRNTAGLVLFAIRHQRFQVL